MFLLYVDAISVTKERSTRNQGEQGDTQVCCVDRWLKRRSFLVVCCALGVLRALVADVTAWYDACLMLGGHARTHARTQDDAAEVKFSHNNLRFIHVRTDLVVCVLCLGTISCMYVADWHCLVSKHGTCLHPTEKPASRWPHSDAYLVVFVFGRSCAFVRSCAADCCQVTQSDGADC